MMIGFFAGEGGGERRTTLINLKKLFPRSQFNLSGVESEKEI
jgi:hypothetical protein